MIIWQSNESTTSGLFINYCLPFKNSSCINIEKYSCFEKFSDLNMRYFLSPNDNKCAAIMIRTSQSYMDAVPIPPALMVIFY